MYDAQTAANLGVDLWLVTVAVDHFMLTAPAESFTRRVQWADNVAVSYNPDANHDSPVRVQPDVRFGKPPMKGVSTKGVAEQHDAGEDAESIARMYDLTPRDVAWALAYEFSIRATTRAG